MYSAPDNDTKSRAYKAAYILLLSSIESQKDVSNSDFIFQMM